MKGRKEAVPTSPVSKKGDECHTERPRREDPSTHPTPNQHVGISPHLPPGSDEPLGMRDHRRNYLGNRNGGCPNICQVANAGSAAARPADASSQRRSRDQPKEGGARSITPQHPDIGDQPTSFRCPDLAVRRSSEARTARQETPKLRRSTTVSDRGRIHITLETRCRLLPRASRTRCCCRPTDSERAGIGLLSTQRRDLAP